MEHGGLDADVAEAAALCHDLGHPPFGHTAEETLDQLLTSATNKFGAYREEKADFLFARELSPPGSTEQLRNS